MKLIKIGEVWFSAKRLLSDFICLLPSKNFATMATWRNDFSSLVVYLVESGIMVFMGQLSPLLSPLIPTPHRLKYNRLWSATKNLTFLNLKNEQLVCSLVGWYIKQMGANSAVKSVRFKGLPIRDYNDVNLFCGKAPSCTLRPRSLLLLCFLKQ